MAVNALIRANFTNFAQFLVDFAADPRLGVPGAELDQTYFTSDKVHLADPGHQIAKDLVKGAVAPFLPASKPYPLMNKSVAGATDATLKSSGFAAVTSLSGQAIVTLTGVLTANISVTLPPRGGRAGDVREQHHWCVHRH